MKINNPLPARFINPDEIINQMDVMPGSTVADFGCGSDYFSIPLAKILGEEGIIYSLDVLPQALEEVQRKAKALEQP